MSSKTGNRHAQTEQAQKAKNLPETVRLEESRARFDKLFGNVFIPLLGVMSLVSLFVQLSSEQAQGDIQITLERAPFYIDLLYNAIVVGCALIAFPFLRSGKRQGWLATMALLAVSAVHTTYATVKSIVETEYLGAFLSAIVLVFFIVLLVRFKNRKSAYTL